MVSFPNCKINLGLSIINKRNDGFHNLETVFYPLPVRDIIEVIPANKHKLSGSSQVTFSTSGLKVDGSDADNLCLKAYYLLQKDFPDLPAIQMHLHKVIPMGAGLGGGSADGAFVLNLLNSMFDLNLSPTRLIDYAQQLGSDCPFFIINKPCFASGRGEIMEPVALDLSGLTFVLINPAILVNTGWAFGALQIPANTARQTPGNFKNVISSPVNKWKELLFNDFEKPVFEKYPEIQLIKEKLYEAGALFSSMTGSGSTVFGIFDLQLIPTFDFPAHYWITSVKI